MTLLILLAKDALFLAAVAVAAVVSILLGLKLITILERHMPVSAWLDAALKWALR